MNVLNDVPGCVWTDLMRHAQHYSMPLVLDMNHCATFVRNMYEKQVSSDTLAFVRNLGFRDQLQPKDRTVHIWLVQHMEQVDASDIAPKRLYSSEENQLTFVGQLIAALQLAIERSVANNLVLLDHIPYFVYHFVLRYADASARRLLDSLTGDNTNAGTTSNLWLNQFVSLRYLRECAKDVLNCCDDVAVDLHAETRAPGLLPASDKVLIVRTSSSDGNGGSSQLPQPGIALPPRLHPHPYQLTMMIYAVIAAAYKNAWLVSTQCAQLQQSHGYNQACDRCRADRLELGQPPTERVNYKLVLAVQSLLIGTRETLHETTVGCDTCTLVRAVAVAVLKWIFGVQGQDSDSLGVSIDTNIRASQLVSDMAVSVVIHRWNVPKYLVVSDIRASPLSASWLLDIIPDFFVVPYEVANSPTELAVRFTFSVEHHVWQAAAAFRHIAMLMHAYHKSDSRQTYATTIACTKRTRIDSRFGRLLAVHEHNVSESEMEAAQVCRPSSFPSGPTVTGLFPGSDQYLNVLGYSRPPDEIRQNQDRFGYCIDARGYPKPSLGASDVLSSSSERHLPGTIRWRAQSTDSLRVLAFPIECTLDLAQSVRLMNELAQCRPMLDNERPSIVPIFCESINAQMLHMHRFDVLRRNAMGRGATRVCMQSANTIRMDHGGGRALLHTSNCAMEAAEPLTYHTLRRFMHKDDGIEKLFGNDSHMRPVPNYVLVADAMIHGSDQELHWSMKGLLDTLFSRHKFSRALKKSDMRIMSENDPCIRMYRLLPMLLGLLQDESDATNVLDLKFDSMDYIWNSLIRPYHDPKALIDQQPRAKIANIRQDCLANTRMESLQRTVESNKASYFPSAGRGEHNRPSTDMFSDDEDEPMRSKQVIDAPLLDDQVQDLAEDQETKQMPKQTNMGSHKRVVELAKKRMKSWKESIAVTEHECDQDDDDSSEASFDSASISVQSSGSRYGGSTRSGSDLSTRAHGARTTKTRKSRTSQSVQSSDDGGSVMEANGIWAGKHFNFDRLVLYGNLLAFLVPRTVRISVDCFVLEQCWQVLLSDAQLWIDHRWLVTFLIEMMDDNGLFTKSGKRLERVPSWLVWREMRRKFILWCASQCSSKNNEQCRPSWDHGSGRYVQENDSADESQSKRRRIRLTEVRQDWCLCATCSRVCCKQQCSATRSEVASGVSPDICPPVGVRSQSTFWSWIEQNYGAPSEYVNRRGLALDSGSGENQILHDPLSDVPPFPCDKEPWMEANVVRPSSRSTKFTKAFGSDSTRVLPTFSQLMPDLLTPIHYLFYLLAVDVRAPLEFRRALFQSIGASCSDMRIGPLPDPELPVMHQSGPSARLVNGSILIDEWYKHTCQKTSCEEHETDIVGASCTAAEVHEKRVAWINGGLQPDPSLISSHAVYPMWPLLFLSACAEALSSLPATPAPNDLPEDDRSFGFRSQSRTRSNLTRCMVVDLVHCTPILSGLARARAPTIVRACPKSCIEDTHERHSLIPWLNMRFFRACDLFSMFDSPFEISHVAPAALAKRTPVGDMTVGPLTLCDMNMVSVALAHPTRAVSAHLISEKRNSHRLYQTRDMSVSDGANCNLNDITGGSIVVEYRPHLGSLHKRSASQMDEINQDATREQDSTRTKIAKRPTKSSAAWYSSRRAFQFTESEMMRMDSVDFAATLEDMYRRNMLTNERRLELVVMYADSHTL